MAMTLKDIRQKYPDYDDLSDVELADKLHSKFYADLPKEEVYKKLDLPTEAKEIDSQGASKPMELTLTKGSEDKGADWRGLAGDTIHMLGRALKNGVGFLGRAPGNIKEIGSELLEHPLSYPPHVAQQVLAGLGEGAKGLANIPHEIFDELADKKITPNWLRTGSIPEDTGVEKFLGLEPTKKSDELLRALPAIYGGGKLAAKPIGAAKRKLTSPSKETLFQRALEKRIDKAGEATDMSKQELANLKESLRRDYAKIHESKLDEVTPIGQEEAIYSKHGKIKELQEDTQIPHEEVGKIPEAPDTDAMVAEKKAALETARKQAEDVLGIKANPRLEAGKKLKGIIEDVKQKSSDLYNAARKHYVDQKIQVDNTAEIKELGTELNELAANEGVFEGTASERQELQSKIDALEGETIDASDLFDLQRTLETMAENTRNKQYESGRGTTELDRKRFGQIADRLETRAKNLETKLESVGGKEVQSMIKEANKGWSTFKAMEKKNPVGKGALAGEIPIRTMIDITKSHPGNDFLKGLIEADPELKKQILAAFTGDSSVNKLLNPDNLTKTYLKALPEVDEHVNALKQALTGVTEGEIQATKVKKEYSDLVKSMKDAAKQQKTRQEAIQKTDKLKEQIKFHEEAIPKIQQKMKKVDETSAEHAKLAKELKDHKKNLADKNYLLKKYGKYVAGYVIGKEVANKFGF